MTCGPWCGCRQGSQLQCLRKPCEFPACSQPARTREIIHGFSKAVKLWKKHFQVDCLKQEVLVYPTVRMSASDKSKLANRLLIRNVGTPEWWCRYSNATPMINSLAWPGQPIMFDNTSLGQTCGLSLALKVGCCLFNCWWVQGRDSCILATVWSNHRRTRIPAPTHIWKTENYLTPPFLMP